MGTRLLVASGCAVALALSACVDYVVEGEEGSLAGDAGSPYGGGGVVADAGPGGSGDPDAAGNPIGGGKPGGGSCTPSCAGRVCGDDGCGGLCGTCPAGTLCGASFTCDCFPSCAGLSCGDDGCGGSCGACPAGWTCTAAGACAEGGGGGGGGGGATKPPAGYDQCPAAGQCPAPPPSGTEVTVSVASGLPAALVGGPVPTGAWFVTEVRVYPDALTAGDPFPLDLSLQSTGGSRGSAVFTQDAWGIGLHLALRAVVPSLSVDQTTDLDLDLGGCFAASGGVLWSDVLQCWSGTAPAVVPPPAWPYELSGGTLSVLLTFPKEQLAALLPAEYASVASLLAGDLLAVVKAVPAPAAVTPVCAPGAECPALPPVKPGATVSQAPGLPPTLKGGPPPSGTYRLEEVVLYPDSLTSGQPLGMDLLIDGGPGTSGAAVFSGATFSVGATFDFAVSIPELGEGATVDDTVSGGGCFQTSGALILADVLQCYPGGPPKVPLPDVFAFEHDGTTVRIGVAISKDGIIAALDEQWQTLAASILTGDAQAILRLKHVP
ncbi:MAG: hypothetical protein AMXMBFR64_23560 [Myxococcales bacterium]